MPAMNIRPRAALLLLPLLVLLALPAAAQIPEGMEEGTFRPHPEGERAISQLYSPFCPGFMLSQCPAAESLALRDSIQALAHAGWESGELVDWMLANHGEEYRAVPQGFGQGLLAWILPPFALLLGSVGVFFALRRFVPSEEADGEGERESDPMAPTGNEQAVTDEDERKLRDAIREIELAEDPSF
ncbi:MAG: hypothetical protein EA352_08890 [Gemmatimonadales bacterium]|nr:MAG: hypothetical protein EA352_08890 [Gemmatimonadales bacterium]